MPNLTEIAQKYACSPRTVTNWKREGAPLSDPARMRPWLLARKNLPAATKLLLQSEGRERRASAAKKMHPFVKGFAAAIANDAEVGAAAGLRRLELAEVDSYSRFVKSQESGDLAELKLAREDWLKIGDSLRKYDLMVEQSRRDSGELLPRAELEQHAESMVRCFRISCLRAASTLAVDLSATGSAQEAFEILNTLLMGSILNGFSAMASAKCPTRLPNWLLAVFLKPMDDALLGVGEIVQGRSAAFDAALAMLSDATSEQIRAALAPQAAATPA